MKYKDLTKKDLEVLAEKIAKQIGPKGKIIGLKGNLGAGKTTFAKSFAKSLGIKSLKSPTFIVAQRYNLKNRHLYHLDFYRLETAKQLEPLGLDEILTLPNIVLIEWVDKFPQISKICDILINLSIRPNDKRNVEVIYKK